MIKIPVTRAQRVHRDLMKEAIQQRRTLYVLKTVALALGGVAAMIFPIFFSTLVVQVLGGLLIAAGTVQVIMTFSPERDAQFLLHFLYALVAIGIGAILIWTPSEGLILVTGLLVLILLIDGLLKFFTALKLQPFRNWRWMLLTGIAASVLALYFWLNLPLVAIWLIGFVVGLQLLIEAFTLGMLLIRTRVSGP